jgi:hypothetical protein
MCLQTFAFGADCAKDSREGQAQLSGRGVRPKITKRDATQRAELCFSRSGDHSGKEWDEKFQCRLRQQSPIPVHSYYSLGSAL